MNIGANVMPRARRRRLRPQDSDWSKPEMDIRTVSAPGGTSSVDVLCDVSHAVHIPSTGMDIESGTKDIRSSGSHIRSS